MKFIFTIISIIIINFLFAQNPNCNAPTAQAGLDVNNVKTTVLNNGMLWWDGGSNSTYEVPNGSGKNVLFTGSIWMGGIDEMGELHVAGMTYGQGGNDFWAGPIEDSTTNMNTCSSFDIITSVEADEIADFINNGTITNNLTNYMGRNNMNFTNNIVLPIDEEFFPFVDVNNDGNYNVNDGDYPKIDGDRFLTWVMNDVGNTHTETEGEPLGIEMKCSAYALESSISAIDNSTFYRYTLTNKSGRDYTDFVFGKFIDPDLGNYQDDFVGCDPEQNFGYCYNGDDNDDGPDGFGLDIPIVAVVLLYAPYEVGNNESKLGSFLSYNNDFSATGNPEEPEDYYGYLNATWKNGTALTYGGYGFDQNNSPTNFMYPSSPDDTNAESWSECSNQNTPSDRRMLMAAKPVHFKAGSTITFDFAVVTSFEFSYPCPDISNLKSDVAEVQNYFDNTIYDPNVSIVDTSDEVIDTMTSIQNINNLDFVEIRPVPAKDFVKITSNVDFVYADLYTLDGKAIENQIEIIDNKIDISNVSILAGIYLLKLKNANNQFIVKKLIVED